MPEHPPQSSPVLFGDAMVRAILSGAKTQTRRLAGVPSWAVRVDERHNNGFTYLDASGVHPQLGGCSEAIFCKFGRPGDQIWVREAWASLQDYSWEPPSEIAEGTCIYYRADGLEAPAGLGGCHAANREPRWRPSMHMCRWMSRLDLEILDVAAERAQSISDADILAEGVAEYGNSLGLDLLPRAIWAHLWDATNGVAKGGLYSWAANPWCFKEK